jgi:hypothetical protein
MHSSLDNWQSDPNVALVDLRAEIECRLRTLALGKGLYSGEAAHGLVRVLAREGVFPSTLAEALEGIVVLGNKAAHGAEVDPDSLGIVQSAGSKVLRSLDLLIGEQLPLSAETLPEGTEVLVPWQWAEARGVVTEMRGTGIGARATVRVQIPGTTEEAEIDFPAKALRPVFGETAAR